ncbi:MAG: sensor histidine kinase [Dehalococcoidia bacterium]
MILQQSIVQRVGWLWRGPGWPPAVLGLVLAVVQIVGTRFAARAQPDREPLDAVAVALLVAGPAALTVRRSHPVAVLWAVVAVTLAYMLLGYPYGPILLSLIVAFYTAVTEGHRRAAWLAAGALYGGHFGLRFLFDGELPTWVQSLAVGAWLLVMLVSFEVVRARREHAREAERTASEEARRRASEERLHIARELHDVLAHHISLINVQAGVGLHLMEKRPEQARIALTAIEHASREAIGELRSVLNILGQPGEQAPRAPAPSLTRLDGLVSQALAAGVRVDTEVEGAPRPLPASVEAAAFRIIQEALTNVVRHARATRATVRVQYGEHDVTVQIDDDGDGRAPKTAPEGGNGIPGMRERAHALGGEFDAGRLPNHGFRVRARLPEAGAA